MQNIKTKDFKKILSANGFHPKIDNGKTCGKGSHQVYERVQTISVPVSGTEVNAMIAMKLIKEYNLVI